jgi:TetR/AcrR family transcriptional regulator, transcriptional repressor for nem operon
MLCCEMARPKEFDREKALARAIKVFAERGYEGSSTELLLKAMGISRQSLYDTFGTKRQLYLDALRRYSHKSTAQILERLDSGVTPLDGIERALLAFIDDDCTRPNPSCLGVGAICEFGHRDPGVVATLKESDIALLKRVVEAFEKAKEAREVNQELDPRTAAGFFLSTLSGLKVTARAGVPVEHLRAIARLALRAIA